MNTSGSEIKIITGNANPELAAKIAEKVGSLLLPRFFPRKTVIL